MGFRIFSKIVLITGMVFGLAACGGGGSSPGSGSLPGGVSSTTPLVTLTSISITPLNPAVLPKGLTQQFTATGHYSNGTSALLTSVTWYSTNSANVTVDTTGLATGVGIGVSYIIAAAGGVTSPNIALYVTGATVTSMTVAPASTVMGIGQPVQFTATAQYSDGTSGDVTSFAGWGASGAVAQMNVTPNVSAPTPGVATGVAAGNATVTATVSSNSGPISARATVTVTNSYAVGGTLSGLPASGVAVTITDNVTDTLTITNNTGAPASNYPFVFNTTLLAGSTYDLTVTAQPPAPAHPCTVVNGSGAISSAAPAPVTSAQIVCGPAVGTIAGRNASGNNGYVNAAISTEAKFYSPMGVAADTKVPGNIYVADAINNVIRLVSASGAVSTFAGAAPTAAGTPAAIGYANSGAGLTPQFYGPAGVAVNKAGNVYVADTHNNVIRMITPAGVVSTLAGAAPVGGAPATAGYTATATSLAAAQFNLPRAIAVDGNGIVYVADTGNFVIRKIVPTGASAGVSTLAGMGPPIGGYVDATGTAAKFNSPYALAVDPTNTYLYVADLCVVRQVNITTGAVATLTGPGPALGYSCGYQDGPAATALFSTITGLALDGLGNLYVADNGKALRMITPGGAPASLSTGTVSTVSSAAYVGFRDGPAASAGLSSAYALSVDASNNVLITDNFYYLIRKYTP